METQKLSKKDYMFKQMPMHKAIFFSSLPSVLMMLFFGAYSFADSVLSVNLANNYYDDNITAQIMGSKNFVRLAMTSTSPINILILSLGLFCGLGIATRVSINLGRGEKVKAENVVKTGMSFALISSLLLMVVLFFVAPSWIQTQYPKDTFGSVSNEGYEYVKIFLISMPFVVMSNCFSSLFVAEGRSKEMLVAMVLPIFLNLFLDWIFMGPLNMGVKGGALATVIAQVTSVILFISFIFYKRSEILKFKNLIGPIKLVVVAGIILVGTSTFLRYFSLSLVQTTQFNIMNDISPHIYEKESVGEVTKFINEYIENKPGTMTSENFRGINGAFYNFMESIDIKENPNLAFLKQKFPQIKVNSNSFDSIHPQVQAFLGLKIPKGGMLDYPEGKSLQAIVTKILSTAHAKSYLSLNASGAFPIIMLLFPSLFGFIQGGVPIIAYNFGAKNIERVKKGYVWCLIFSFLITSFIYFVGAFIFVDVLLNILGITEKYLKTSKSILRIMLLMLPLLSIGMSGMVILSATDKITLSIIAASLNGILIFYPLQYIMKEIAISNPDTWWLYFLGNPIGALISSVIIVVMVAFVFKGINKKQITLDERILSVEKWVINRKQKRLLKK